MIKIFYSFFIGAFAALILAGISFFATIIIGDSVIGHSFKIGWGGWWTTILSFTKSDEGFSAGIGGGAILIIAGMGILNGAIAMLFQMRKNKAREKERSRLI
ncbi:MAG: hypothetical protein AAB793_01760 [Patescibacteria group bacterium]